MSAQRNVNLEISPANLYYLKPSVKRYVELPLVRPREMGSLEFTLFWGFANELHKQRAAFLAPGAEPLMRELFTHAATYLTHVERTSVISIRNLAIGNIHGLGLYSNHELVMKYANALSQSPLLPDAGTPVDAGPFSNNCKLRKDLKESANVAFHLHLNGLELNDSTGSEK